MVRRGAVVFNITSRKRFCLKGRGKVQQGTKEKRQ